MFTYWDDVQLTYRQHLLPSLFLLLFLLGKGVQWWGEWKFEKCKKGEWSLFYSNQKQIWNRPLLYRQNWELKCVKETTIRPKSRKKAEDHQWVFNPARTSCRRRRASADPLRKMCTSSMKMKVTLNSKIHIKWTLI